MRTAIFILSAAVFAAPASAQTVSITYEECQRFTRHVPDDDVTYKPGVDAQGRSVAPADLNGGFKIDPPTEFSIPVTIDLQKRFGLPMDPNLFQTEAQIGNIVYRDGRAWFNGQPLPLENRSEIIRVCKELLAKHE